MSIHSSADHGYRALSWCSKCGSADLNCGCDVEPDVHVSSEKLSIDDDMGTETYIKTIRTQSYLALRRAVRELNPGRIPIYSDYDCTGLVCWQGCKFLKVYRCYAGFLVGVVEITVSRDV